MLDYWSPYLYCKSDSLLGFALINLIVFFYAKIWWIIGGIAWKSGEIYLTFLIVYGFHEELFINYFLTHAWPDERPLCTLDSSAFQRSQREFGLPSLEAQLTFSIAAFLIAHMFLVRGLTRFYATVAIVSFPFLTVASLYVTRNNTGVQLAVGAALGIFNGIRRVLLYHFFYKHTVIALHNYPLFRLIIPGSDLTVTEYEDRNDQDALMLEQELADADISVKQTHEMKIAYNLESLQ